MSGVVLRCPNCGTTKAGPGECEACHEAQVRQFCTNHTPGRWLDGPACPECGARLGDPARAPAAPPRPAAPARGPAPASATAPPGAAPTSWRRKVSGGPREWVRRERSPSPGGVPDARVEVSAARDALIARLPKLLRGVSRVRRAPAATVEPTYVPGAAPATGLALGGCLGRALFLVVFLLAALTILSVLLGGSLLQIFGGYYY